MPSEQLNCKINIKILHLFYFRPYMYVSGFDWTYLWNSMWCTIITMATVGYGDYYPETHIGRFIAILACIWGNFLISLMVVSLTISSEFSPS